MNSTFKSLRSKHIVRTSGQNKFCNCRTVQYRSVAFSPRGKEQQAKGPKC